MDANVRDRHQDSEEWPNVTAEDCAAEIAVTCSGCRQSVIVHVEPTAYRDLKRKHRGMWWRGWLADHGWETRVGFCKDCYATVRDLAGRRN